MYLQGHEQGGKTFFVTSTAEQEFDNGLQVSEKASPTRQAELSRVVQ